MERSYESGIVQVLPMGYFVENGINSPAPVPIDLAAEGSVGVSVIPFRTEITGGWTTDAPVLTVPDLEDSVERMYARRVSGITEVGFMPTQRSYPTDPISVKKAADFLAEYQKELSSRVEADKQQIAQIKATAEKTRKHEQREREEFEAYKQQKQAIKSEIK